MFASSTALPTQSPVQLHGSIQFDLPSSISGRTYRIFVFKPATPPPASGYPTILCTDGNGTFPLMATMSAAFELTGSAALVVGVGYPTDDAKQLFTLRNHDLTVGSDHFRRFLIEELRPAIAAAYAVDDDDQTLYGHSIAGAFALDVLFNHPTLFRNYVLSSPSIWLNDRAVLNNEASFIERGKAGEVSPNVLILVGGNETDAQWRMLENARELAERLNVHFHVFKDEDHLTSLGASIGQTLAFALRRR